QVGQVVTRQDRRDFSAGEVVRAMTQLGFTCRGGLPRTAVATRRLSPLQRASAMLGTPVTA
ncbi:SCO5918 family protein, partial [Streptomyces sp. NPDC020817]